MTTHEQSKNAIAWIEALLSGKYKQGKGRLGDGAQGFCCWGLGCHVVGRFYEPTFEWNEYFYRDVGFLKMNGEIHPQFYGLPNLADVNDTTNAGFKRIGKYLIKHAGTNFNEDVAYAIQKHFEQ